jgi:hypothetical protein
MRIATGEVSDETPAVNKNPAAVSLGSAGGKARAKKLGVRRRKAIARQAAEARWKNR